MGRIAKFVCVVSSSLLCFFVKRIFSIYKLIYSTEIERIGKE